MRAQGKRIAFAPTMGALHDGHVSLVKIGLEKADVAASSIFVNPTQFAAHEDLATYPRAEESDLAEAGGGRMRVLLLPLRRRKCTRREIPRGSR